MCYYFSKAQVVKLVDTRDLKPRRKLRAGSSPALGTKIMSNDKYITIPYTKIWLNIVDKIILKLSVVIFLSASATLFFNNYKTYEANSSLEQVISPEIMILLMSFQ